MTPDKIPVRTVYYTRSLQRQVAIAVSEKVYADLHQTEDKAAREEAESMVIDAALSAINDEPLEHIYTSVTDEDSVELFDV